MNPHPNNPRPNKHLTDSPNKRKLRHFRPIADYIAIFTNSPPGVPHSKLFADKHEYGYFRWVIHQWKHGKLTRQPNKQGHPLMPSLDEVPVDVHHTPFRTEILPAWIPLFKNMVVSKNQNGQLVYRDPQGYFGLVIHKRGSVQFAPYLNVKTAWDRLEAYLKDSIGEDRTKLFLEALHKTGIQTHVAFHTPGVSQFRVKIPGIANIESDKTPWKDGTSEVIIDTKDITNTLRGMNELMVKFAQNELAASENNKLFGENLKAHVIAIEKLSDAADRIGRASESTTSRAVIEAPKEQPQARHTLDGWTQPEPRHEQKGVHDCIHGWTPELVEQNYRTGLTCDRCTKVHSCKVVEKAYELNQQKAAGM